MAAFYKIDKERKLVFTTGSGALTRADLDWHQTRLLKDPDFDPSYSQLADFTHVTQVEITEADIRLFAQRSIFTADSRRAFIVKDDAQEMLARMFEKLRKEYGERGIRVFRELDAGLDWLFTKHIAR